MNPRVDGHYVIVYKQILIGQVGRVNQITMQEVGVPYPVWINTEGLKIIEEKVLTVHNLGCPVVSRVTILEIFFSSTVYFLHHFE